MNESRKVVSSSPIESCHNQLVSPFSIKNVVVTPFARVTLVLLVVKELKTTNETLKSLQTQLELSYATTATSGEPVAGNSLNFGETNTATILGGSVAVPGGVPGSTTLTAILETKDARIQTLEKQVELLEAEHERIKDCSGRVREQLLRVISLPNNLNQSFMTTGVSNPFVDYRLNQHQSYAAQQQQAAMRHLKLIEPAAKGGLILHAHNFNKLDANFKRQVSFFINNVRIQKYDAL